MHRWELTTSREYFASSKSRQVFKITGAVFGMISFLGFDESVTMGYAYAVLTNIVAPSCLIAIPYNSLWLDVFVGIWNFADCRMDSVSGATLWILLTVLAMHVGGIHSLALVPILLLPLANRELISHAYDCTGMDLRFFSALSILVVVWIFVAEWRQANRFYLLQKSTEATQLLLLTKPPVAFCTLSRESGIVSDASSAFDDDDDRSGGATLGLDLDVDLDEGSALLVEGVKEGLVEQWNSSNEEAEVRGGDYLVEVNGIDGSSRRMLSELCENKLLEIVVLRSRAITATSRSSSRSF